MDFEVRKIRQALDLGDYEEDYRGQVLFVWVNPTEAMREARRGLVHDYGVFVKQIVSTATPRRRWIQPLLKLVRRSNNDAGEVLEGRNQAWLAEILNQNEESPCSADELARLKETDEVLYHWILRRAVEMIDGYQENKKKASKTPLKN